MSDMPRAPTPEQTRIWQLERELAEARRTFRDEFAMACMTGMLASEGEDFQYGSPEAAAAEAYKHADAMLAERSKKK